MLNLSSSKTEACWERRRHLIDPTTTDSYRLVHGAADGWPGWYLDRLGPALLSQSEKGLDPAQWRRLRSWAARLKIASIYHKRLIRQTGTSRTESLAPELQCGPALPQRFVIRENGIQYYLSFEEGYSVGLFLDQRENRKRLLDNQVTPGFPVFDRNPKNRTLLNTFAYTCGFSICAGLSGARTCSIDLSRKYLAWGGENVAVNGLEKERHQFLQGDVFSWLRRLQKKGRKFDAIVLDPPTFSRSKESGVFRAEKDFGHLLAIVLPLLPRRGVILASTNAAGISEQSFLANGRRAIVEAKGLVEAEFCAPQPPDFPVAPGEPAHLKTVWWRIRREDRGTGVSPVE